jgi:uncharacterized protein
VISVDAGFLVALADPGDSWHPQALAMAPTVDEGWISTWPALTEACYLLMRRRGAEAAAALLEDITDGGFMVWALPDDAAPRMANLMRRYAKLPMDLADASLVLLAEHLGHGRILTTDQREFGADRWKSRKPFRNLIEEHSK